MKKHFLVFAAILIFISGCNTKSNQEKHGTGRTVTDTVPTFSRFIPRDSANKMITSYLNSVPNNDTNLRALIIDMDQLRRYTDSMETTIHIAHLKLFFAHTLEYINAGHGNQNAGYKSGALTLILAGFDSSGNYVYYNGNTVLEYMAPCPTSCPEGQAGGSLLTN